MIGINGMLGEYCGWFNIPMIKQHKRKQPNYIFNKVLTEVFFCFEMGTF